MHVVRPVFPTLATGCPRRTQAPFFTRFAQLWLYRVTNPLPWSMVTVFPKPRMTPEKMTLPDRTARMGVPARAGMSMPSWRLPPLGPKGEETRPSRGLIRGSIPSARIASAFLGGGGGGRGSSMRIRGTRVSPRCRALYSARVGSRSESFLGTRSFSPARTLSSRTASSLARSMVRGDTPYLPAMNATDSPLRTECSTHGRELAEAAGEKKRTAITEKKLKERTRKRNAGKKAQNRPLR